MNCTLQPLSSSFPRVAYNIAISCNGSILRAKFLTEKRGIIRPSLLVTSSEQSMTLNSPGSFNYYYCKLALCSALRRVCCPSFCRNPVLKLLHARTNISCHREKYYESHPSVHSLRVEHEQSVSLTLEKHTPLFVTGFILQGEK